MFGSPAEFVARRGDVGFWRPHLAAILERHDLPDAGQAPVAGYNPTHPTFVCGDVVVKFFGHVPTWRRSHAAEHAAQRLVATDARIRAPRLLAAGRLFEEPAAPWPYLVTARAAGTSCREVKIESELTSELLRTLAADLGRQLRLVHALCPTPAVAEVAWPVASVSAGAQRSSLPAHLVRQVDAYLARLGPSDPVFVHSDLCRMHVFLEDARLSSIIDWGDAMVADRHYELIQVHRDTFGCDKALLGAFLDAYEWPVETDFADRALGAALVRQAVGLVQHGGMDVFEPVAALLPLNDIPTLEDLATALFGI